MRAQFIAPLPMMVDIYAGYIKMLLPVYKKEMLLFRAASLFYAWGPEARRLAYVGLDGAGGGGHEVEGGVETQCLLAVYFAAPYLAAIECVNLG